MAAAAAAASAPPAAPDNDGAATGSANSGWWGGMPAGAGCAAGATADEGPSTSGRADAPSDPAAPARMRRIASAPAFRAACANTAPPATPAAAPALPPPAHCACAAAAAGGRCGCLEVYVVSRAFTEFGGPLLKRMTPEMRLSMVDLGICHYMTVFKTPDGRFHQFDFGPHGGDVEKVNGPLAAWLRRARRQQQQLQQAAPAGGAGAAGPSGTVVAGGAAQQQAAVGGAMRQSPSAPALELYAALAAAEALDGCGVGGGGAGGPGGGRCVFPGAPRPSVAPALAVARAGARVVPLSPASARGCTFLSAARRARACGPRPNPLLTPGTLLAPPPKGRPGPTARSGSACWKSCPRRTCTWGARACRSRTCACGVRGGRCSTGCTRTTAGGC